MHDSRGGQILELCVALPFFGQSAAVLMPVGRASFQHLGQRQEAFKDPPEEGKLQLCIRNHQKAAGRKSGV